ncbi:MAG: FimV/HubP family polar landmark protein [Gammaproteobacteria bacterium]|nr:FimV/HubP family polar landmark protein [Gammaproteobacteria bacterium]MDG2338862.1 FimV/HubP family polar landmark protein [Gammaproteobacteria bacterium]
MLRKFVVILTMLLCSMATQLYALGLGTVTVESALNQPLRMRIELLQLGDTLLQNVRVSMASAADFERFNVQRESFLSNIRFSVESTANGNVVILTSSQIVREPYLSFILDTRWPNGRSLSEHTILLDLPVFNDQQSTAEVRQPISSILQAPAAGQLVAAEPFVEVQTSPVTVTPSSTNTAANLQPEVIAADPEQTETAIPDEVAEQVAAADPTVVEEVAEPEPTVVEEAIEAAEEPQAPEVLEPETPETDGSDTLSDIAIQVRPDDSVSMQQTMLAIQELNPDAFADGNINQLRSGQVLRIPNLAEIQAIDSRDAVEEVTRQNIEFATADGQPLAAPTNVEPTQDDQPQGQLSVVSSDDAIDASSGAAKSADVESEVLDQRIVELEAQLAQRQEEADRARVEREELDSRMAELDAQIAAAQEIIRLQDIQLAQLQESLAAAAAEAQLLADQQAIQDAAAAEAVQPVESSSSVFDDVLRILTGNSIFMISGVALAILLLVLLMLRRNSAAKIVENDLEELVEEEFDAAAAGVNVEFSEEISEEGAGEDKSATEFQDYDPADRDSELDEIIGLSGVNDGSNEGEEKQDLEENQQQLDVLSIVEQLVSEQQYRRGLSMLNTSLQEQGENEEVRAKIAEIETLLEAEDAEQQVDDEAAKAQEAGEADTFGFDFDLDDDSGTVDSDEEEPEALDIETLEFDADAATEVQVDMATDGDKEIDLEIFSFDSEAAAEAEQDVAAEEDPSAVEFAFDKADLEGSTKTPESASNEEVETFDFDLDEGPGDTILEKPAVDGDAATSDTLEDFDFDLDEFEIEPASDEASRADVTDITSGSIDDDFLDLDAETGNQGSIAATEDDISELLSADGDTEIEFDIDDEPEEVKTDSAESDKEELFDEDDLDFLSDGGIEIESVDDIEEVDMLSDADETATKLELAYAYKKMGDTEGAKEILQEVITEGSDEQIAEATKLLGTLGE